MMLLKLNKAPKRDRMKAVLEDEASEQELVQRKRWPDLLKITKLRGKENVLIDINIWDGIDNSPERKVVVINVREEGGVMEYVI